jgi:hypothetical protein
MQYALVSLAKTPTSLLFSNWQRVAMTADLSGVVQHREASSDFGKHDWPLPTDTC